MYNKINKSNDKLINSIPNKLAVKGGYNIKN